MMILFTSALMPHKLKFTKLSERMELVTIAAVWAETEWGYIRNKGVEYREGVLSAISANVYIGTFGDQPVAMFALLDHEFHKDLIDTGKKLPHVRELMYVYVEENHRGLGFGLQIINEAKCLAKEAGADLILLDTLKPGLNRMYEKQGAVEVCEGSLFLQRTDVMRMGI